jgi:hypothetical protein
LALTDTNKYNPDAIRDAFSFLIKDFSYSIVRAEELLHNNRPYAYVIEYIGHERRIHLSHDYKENFFYFTIIRGLNTQHPNDNDHENIIPFWRLFKSHEPSLELTILQPDTQTCAEAASLNAQLLQKYASSILRGEEWI